MVIYNVEFKHTRARRWRSSDLRHVCTNPDDAGQIIQGLRDQARARARAESWNDWRIIDTLSGLQVDLS